MGIINHPQGTQIFVQNFNLMLFLDNFMKIIAVKVKHDMLYSWL